MKIAFDSRPAPDPRGIGRYVSCLMEALLETAPPGAELVESHRPRRVDAFHSPWIDGAMLRPPCPQVVTLHDVVPLKRRSEYLRSGIRFRMRYLAVERSTLVIVPSAVVAAEVTEHLGIGSDRLVVVPEAPAPALRERGPKEIAAVRKRYRLPADYLLWVGGLQTPDPRKRIAALAKAPRELPLVLVGATKPWAHELPDVTLTGHVSDDHLAAIYSGARALVFPSDDEGFGLPTVEALACGTPVVASDLPVLREVLGDRATFVASGDLEGLLAAGAAARRPAPKPPAWTWHDAARATWQVYEDASSDQPRRLVRTPVARWSYHATIGTPTAGGAAIAGTDARHGRVGGDDLGRARECAAGRSRGREDARRLRGEAWLQPGPDDRRGAARGDHDAADRAVAAEVLGQLERAPRVGRRDEHGQDRARRPAVGDAGEREDRVGAGAVDRHAQPTLRTVDRATAAAEDLRGRAEARRCALSRAG